ncbi:MAG TPA: toll/interleukin-1 receptor domain-containing protein [Pyrinomonadaceae bacterium]|nr:toll/interleukin-1 receptor domain-containing protein [Pyrinomonadaceae bacterium]
MAFEYDIFISYAHIDNQPPARGLDGWVESLHERLKVKLAQLLGEEVSVWRDRKLQGNDVFADTLVAELEQAAVMVSVLSPRYVKSEWCLRELEEFCRRAEASGGLRIGNKSRLFKVIKSHVPLDEQPEAVRGMVGYEFFKYDEERGRALEFDTETAPQTSQEYWGRLTDLAHDIADALKALKGAGAQAAGARAATAAPAAGKTVYLATTTSDVSAERDRIRRELQERGYGVLPDRELPLRAPEFEPVVRADLARSDLSVHLVGANYGLIPEGEEERSVVRWQEELAAERGAADPAFTRLIWVPPGLEPAGVRQRAFVGELQTRLGAGAELLQTTVEDLKLRVLEKLNPAPKPAPTPGDVKSVYLVCDDRDTEEVAPIEEFLFDAGYEVIPTLPSDDTQQLAQYHRESLVNCDAALVYYGRANQMWLRSKLWDLQKAQGWGRETPMLAKAVYVSGPPTTEKQRFRTREVPVVIQNYEGFSPDALRPFLQAMRAGNGGQQ